VRLTLGLLCTALGPLSLALTAGIGTIVVYLLDGGLRPYALLWLILYVPLTVALFRAWAALRIRLEVA
jgi:hypothetical protein